MGKTKPPPNQSCNKTEDKSAVKSSNKKKKRPEIQVVQCAASFPTSQRVGANKLRRQRHEESDSADQSSSQPRLLDWHDTAKEIRSLGATAFVGQQKRSYDDEQYELLTGRRKKKHQVPLPIVRGIKKAAAKRQARELKEAREAGNVLPKSVTDKKKRNKKARDRTSQVHGPAPSVGFMSKGVLRVKSGHRSGTR